MKSAIKMDTKTLRRLAGPRSFERGEAYFEDGRVGSLVEDKGKITAFVHGSSKYRVKLWDEDDNLEYECSCPVGRDGDFCKHCVAVVLTWLAGNDNNGKSAPSSGPKVTFKDIRSYLLTQDKETLTEMILDQAAGVIELCEYSLRKVEKAINHLDDSDGHMGGILERLQELHLSACKKAKPDPEALAKRLFDWEISGEWDTFYGAVKTYSELEFPEFFQAIRHK